jgi:formaldehyde-activating enzyme involved in methanogenesis
MKSFLSSRVKQLNVGVLGYTDNSVVVDILGNIKLSGEIHGPSNFVIDPATVGDDTGTVVIKGNLQIDGETTTINSTIVSIDDKNIVLASGALNTAAADGAGITIDGANATMLYRATNDSFVFNKTLYHNTDIVLTAASQFGGDVSGTYDNITVTDDSHNHSFDNLLSKNAGTGNYTTTGSFTGNTLVSNVGTGTAPLEVTSTTLVANLNVDKLDDQHGSYYLNLANATGTLATTKGGTNQTTYTTGDILYSSAANTLSKLSIGSNNQILSVSSGVPTWKSFAASDIGAISGIDIEENTTSLGAKTIISFGSGLTAITDLNDTNRAIVSLSLNASDVGIDIIEESGTSLGKASTLKFVGRATTATFDAVSSTATLTLSDTPTFSTITLDVGTGTAPLTVTSTTLVSNLNADLLDDQHGSYYLNLNNATGILATTKGGTGLSSYTTGDILYSSATDTLSKLTIGTPNQILSVSASGIPEWINPTVAGINILEEGTLVGSSTIVDFVGRAITATFDAPSSTATLTLSDDPTFNTITSDVGIGTAPLVVTSTTLVANLNADLLDGQEGIYYLDLNNSTGILATIKGGTGLSSYTTGDILYSSAANTLSKLTIGSQNQILSVSSTGIPEWIDPTVAKINILEEGTSVGSATSVDFVGRAITATFDAPSSTATLTLSDDPTFNTITSDVATGTAPLVVTSTTLVANLNVDKLDGEDGSYYLDLANATGVLDETKGGTGQTTYTTGDILYSSATDTLSKLTIGSPNQVLSVSSGVPAWKSLNASDVGAITGIDIEEDSTNLGTKTIISFGSGLTAITDPNNSNRAIIDAGIDIIEESGTSLGKATTLKFVGRATTATFDAPSSTATLTLSDTPTFSTITLDVATGTAPLVVTSTTLVSNLNADKLDDQEGTYYLDLANATGVLDETKGGTGQTTYTTGDILYSSAANTLSKLTIGSQNQILSVSASGIPEWINPTVSGINILEEGTLVGSATDINFVGRAITATFATSTATITLSDTPTFSTITSDVATGTAPLVVTSTTLVSNLNADKLDGEDGSYYLDLANATGSLGETKGGTGQTTYATGDILYSSAANTLSKLTIGSQNQILSVSASGIPEWINPTVGGINILEEGTLVGSAINIDFVGRAITASFATSTATITLSDTPTFSTITSDVATGTAPLVVTSTTLVSNLNADKLDDQEGTYYLDLANATGSLGETKGGTGQTTYTTGDILYSSATDTLSKLTIGSPNQVLTVDATGVPTWKTASTASAGEQDAFNTSLTHTVLASLTGVGGTVLTLPSAAGIQYIIHSIHVANTEPGNDEVNVVGSFDFNNGDRSYFAYSIPIPTGTGIELLINPQVLGPSDSISMRSLDLNRNGADDYVEVYITYQEVTSTEYIGVGYGQDLGTGDYGIPTTASTTIYTSSTYPSVINSIRLTNRTDTGGYPISVSITSGANTIRLVDNLIVPKYGSVELLETPKRLSMNDTINVQVDQVGTIDVQVSGQQIV